MSKHTMIVEFTHRHIPASQDHCEYDETEVTSATIDGEPVSAATDGLLEELIARLAETEP